MKVDLYNLTAEEAAKATKTLDKLFGDLDKARQKREAERKPGAPGPHLVSVHYRHGQLLTGDQAWRRDHGGRRRGVGKKK